MSRVHYRQNPETGAWEPFDPASERKRQETAAVHQDETDAFQSMVDGSWWTSKARYRQHLKANGKIEVGNDVDGFVKKNPFETREYQEQLKEDLTRSWFQVRDGMAPLTEHDRERCKRINEQQKSQNHDRRERDKLGRIR